MTETLTVAESTVISPLDTPELRISLRSDRGGVESYYFGSDKWFCVLWLFLSDPITLRATIVGHNGSSDNGGVVLTVLYERLGSGRSHLNFG